MGETIALAAAVRRPIGPLQGRTEEDLGISERTLNGHLRELGPKLLAPPCVPTGAKMATPRRAR